MKEPGDAAATDRGVSEADWLWLLAAHDAIRDAAALPDEAEPGVVCNQGDSGFAATWREFVNKGALCVCVSSMIIGSVWLRMT